MSSQHTKLMHVTTVPESLWFLTGQLRYMAEHGLRVSCVSSPGPRLSQFSEAEHIPAHAVEMPRRISPFQDFGAVVRLCRTFRQTRPHIVHAHTPKGGLLGMISACLAGVPVRVYHIHGLPFVTQHGWKRQLLMWTERIACLMATQVLCVSPSVRDLAETERLCSPAKIKVLLGGSVNGVDSHGRFNPARLRADRLAEARRRHGLSHDSVVIGFVGRIVRDKGVHELAEAWQTLRQRHPNLQLIIVGEPEPQDPIDPEVLATLQADSAVHFTGQVDEPEYVYGLLDVLVLPSYREGLGMVLLEAAAMAVPVVATRIPGCVDAVVDGGTGTLVRPHDGQALAEALSRYVADVDLRRHHGLAARKMVLSRFDQQQIWEATRQEYDRLLKERGLSVDGTGATHTEVGR